MNWYNPDLWSPDYFNRCTQSSSIDVPSNAFGFQEPRTGNAYAGIYAFNADTSACEYVQVKLTKKLSEGSLHYVEFYVSLADSASKYALNNIGVVFSTTKINGQYDRISAIPKVINNQNNALVDKQNWIKVEGNFMASGNEEYMTIGNFNAPADDDTVFVNGGYSFSNYKYAYYYIDDVSVIEIAESVSIYPNPAQDFVSIELPKTYTQAQLSIYNLTGQLISQKQITQPTNSVGIPSGQIPITELGNGMYIFVIQNEDKVIGRQRVVVAR
ncbi:MAG: T9SS type A sorting domain-containing protein [Sphingobacteriales bacterium JAD_PAG50586_3]|nr:MAG: T9SS type A sorting domain-containing protein [Sphingobacteriales bacterium JAD_PAG50586_3]